MAARDVDEGEANSLLQVFLRVGISGTERVVEALDEPVDCERAKHLDLVDLSKSEKLRPEKQSVSRDAHDACRELAPRCWGICDVRAWECKRTLSVDEFEHQLDELGLFLGIEVHVFLLALPHAVAEGTAQEIRMG